MHCTGLYVLRWAVGSPFRCYKLVLYILLCVCLSCDAVGTTSSKREPAWCAEAAASAPGESRHVVVLCLGGLNPAVRAVWLCCSSPRVSVASVVVAGAGAGVPASFRAAACTRTVVSVACPAAVALVTRAAASAACVRSAARPVAGVCLCLARCTAITGDAAIYRASESISRLFGPASVRACPLCPLLVQLCCCVSARAHLRPRATGSGPQVREQPVHGVRRVRQLHGLWRGLRAPQSRQTPRRALHLWLWQIRLLRVHHVRHVCHLAAMVRPCVAADTVPTCHSAH